MANVLESRLRDELTRLGAQISPDGKLGFADPKLNEVWKDFAAKAKQRSDSAAIVPDASAEAARRARLANDVNAEARSAANDETVRYGLNSLPVVAGKEAIATQAFGDRLGLRVDNYNRLLNQENLHERALYGDESVRLDKILENDKYYTDVMAKLSEKQLAQQGTANVMNLITNLALGGAALFA